MKYKVIQNTSQWEFAVLEYFEQLIGRDRGRLVGYVAEHLLDVWLEKNSVDYVECDVALMDKKNDLYRKIDFLCRKIGIKHRFIKV